MIGIWDISYNIFTPIKKMSFLCIFLNFYFYLGKIYWSYNLQFLSKNNFGPELFSVFKNGICYAFIPGETLTTESIQEEIIWTSIGKQLAKLHKIEVR